MKKALLVVLMGLLLLQALPAFAQEASTETNTNSVKKYAVQFSLAGAFGGKNSFFEGEVVGAFKLGVINNNTDMFTQIGVMANAFDGNWEYGASIGLGGRKEGTMIYGFLDALYSHGHRWIQARMLLKFYLGDWAEFFVNYSYGLSKAVQLKDGMEMRIENSARVNLSVFLTSWLELSGSARSIGNFGQKRLIFNAELNIRPFKWASVNLGVSGGTVGWMNPGDPQADWSIVSNMLTRGFRIVFNLGRIPIRGSSAQAQTVPVPILPLERIPVTWGNSRDEEYTTPRPITVLMEYERWVPGGYYPKSDSYFPGPDLLKGGFTYLSEDFDKKNNEVFSKNLKIETNTIYTGHIADLAMGGYVAQHVKIDGTKAINLNGENTPYGDFKFYVKNDRTVVFLSK